MDLEKKKHWNCQKRQKKAYHIQGIMGKSLKMICGSLSEKLRWKKRRGRGSVMSNLQEIMSKAAYGKNSDGG